MLSLSRRTRMGKRLRRLLMLLARSTMKVACEYGFWSCMRCTVRSAHAERGIFTLSSFVTISIGQARRILLLGVSRLRDFEVWLETGDWDSLGFPFAPLVDCEETRQGFNSYRDIISDKPPSRRDSVRLVGIDGTERACFIYCPASPEVSGA